MMKPMKVSFRCAECGRLNRAEFDDATRQLSCSACDASVTVPVGVIRDGELQRCVVCPSTELFVRKDFPRSLGMLIIASGIVASTVAWAMYRPIITFAILGATALLDLLAFGLVGDVLECYRCHSEYRAVKMQSHSAFDMTTFESHRQHAARLAQHAARMADKGQSN
jgi:hypothetical protein